MNIRVCVVGYIIVGIQCCTPYMIILYGISMHTHGYRVDARIEYWSRVPYSLSHGDSALVKL